MLDFTLKTEKAGVIFVEDTNCVMAELLIACDDDFLLNGAFIAIRVSSLLKTTFTTVHPLFLRNSLFDNLKELKPIEPPLRGMPRERDSLVDECLGDLAAG